MPAPYDQKKRLVIPDALKVLRLKNHRKFCLLGDLSTEVGWGKRNLVEKLEDKRRSRAEAWWKSRNDVKDRVKQAQNSGEIAKIRTELAQYGY